MSDRDKPTLDDVKRPSNDEVTIPERPNAVVRDRSSEPSTRYLPGREIARGGMGRVALATDTLLERTVAVKQALTLDPEMLRRFTRETKITARLEHPSIVPVYDAGTDGEAPFYVMRRVSGQPLSELILSSNALDARLALVPNVLAAAQAVAHAHSRGIVHRDIKPSNILVGDFGETVVIDWGLAKVVGDPDDDDDPMSSSAGDSLRTRAGTVFGTPGFMSPGQLRGEAVGYSADVYALGATLYFALAGTPPHHAKTGEAMMALAAEGPPVPLAELVPGVPRELATIVDTALAYGETKYENASEFAEDVRRFSTGQLVAAHHYSSRERLLRFVRRYRAAIAIAVIAAAVIAVGTTLFVRRILEESARANEEAEVATAAKRQSVERADQLLLLRARMLVDQNPTEAVALLKDLDPTSRRVSEAQGLATGALMRGVPWGMRPPDATTGIVQLDSTGELMLQTTIRGELFVWDLIRHTLVARRDLGFGGRGIWIGHEILIHGKDIPTLRFDPRANTTSPTGLPPLRQITGADDDSLFLAIVSETREPLQFDRDLQHRTNPWPGHRIEWMDVTGNGAWLVMTDASAVVVVSRDGKELTTRKGRFDVVHASARTKVAVHSPEELWEIELLPEVKWTKLDVSKYSELVVSFGYRGDDLQLALASGHLLAYREHKLYEIMRTAGISFYTPAGDDEFLYVVGQKELVYANRYEHRTIPLPQLLTNAKLAARPGVDRVVVAAGEALLIYDLAGLRPRKLPVELPSSAEFYDEHTLLFTDANALTRLSWLDIDTDKLTEVRPRFPGMSHTFAFDPTLGKVIQHVWRGETSTLTELHPHSQDAKVIYEGPPISAHAILGDGRVVYARDRSLVLLGTPDRELATTKERIFAIAPRGKTGIAAASYEGELLRGEVDGTLERVQLAPLPALLRKAPNGRLIPPLLEVADGGEIVVGWGLVVWRWNERLEPLATFGTPIASLRAVGNNVLALMPNRTSVLVELATGVQHGLPPHGTEVVLGPGGHALAFDVAGSYHFVDFASHTMWPSGIQKFGVSPALSPSGQRLIALVAPEGVLMWTIPHATGLLRQRLDAATNATINSDGLLTWPWN